MVTVTIPKKQYRELLEKSLRYEYLQQIIKEKEDIFIPPPTRDIKKIVKDFRKIKLYSPSFLKSLQKGLKRSSYFGK